MATTNNNNKGGDDAVGNCWSAFKIHLQRSLMWQLREIQVSVQESSKLIAVPNQNELLCKYLVWRKSSLLLSSFFVVITALLAFVGIGEYEWSVLNGFGQAALLMDILSPSILAGGVIASLVFWARKPRMSIVLLNYVWILTLVLPLWPSIIPLEYFFEMDGFGIQVNDDELQQVAEFFYRASAGILYAINIFPVAVSVPGGVIRGALRIRGLLPESTLAGWMIVVASPFYPLVVLMALVLLCQVFGNELLVIGSLAFLAAPSFYLWRRSLYTQPKLTEEEINRLNWNQRIIMMLSIFGVTLISAWALIDAQLPFTVFDFFRFVTSFIGRLLVTSVVFADIALRMTVADLEAQRTIREGTVLGNTDELLRSLETSFADLREGNNDNTKTKEGNSPKPKKGKTPDVEAQRPSHAAPIDATEPSQSNYYEGWNSQTQPEGTVLQA